MIFLILKIVFTLFLIFALAILWKMFHPFFFALQYRLQFGKKAIIIFYPFGGFYHYLSVSTKKTQDCWTWLREKLIKNPEAKIVAGNFLIRPSILVVDQDIAKEFMTTKEQNYQKPDVMYRLDLFLEQGLLFSYGKRWKRQRALLRNVFHFDSLKSYVPLMHKVTQERLLDLDLQADTNKPVHILRAMQKITGEIVIRAFFGENYSKIIDNYSFSTNINDTFRDITSIHRDPKYTFKRLIIGTKRAFTMFQSEKEKKCFKKIQILREMAFNVIEDRISKFDKNNQSTKDFLDIHINHLLSEENKSIDDPELQLTKEEIVHQFITFYFAGQESTSTFCAMILIMLSRHPQIYEKVQNEIDTLFPNPEEITHESLKKMDYTNAFFKEVLRVYQPASDLTARIAKNDHQIGEFPVKKGTAVNINLNCIMRDQRIYEDPHTIKPERWLNGKANDKQIQSFVPFSLGPRNCIGQHMAQIEAGIITAYILKRFRIQRDDHKPLIMTVTPLYQPQNDDIIRLYKK